MGGVFNYDGVLIQTLVKLTNYVFLSVLWVVFSLPLVTIGASTTALYYTVNKVVRHDQGYVWQEFWSAFKENFKQSTGVWLILICVYSILIGDCYITYLFYKLDVVPKVVPIVFFIFLNLTTMWAVYLFPYIARFSNVVKHILKNCVIMSFQNFLWSVLLLMIFIVIIFIFLLVPILILILPVACSMLHNLILERIFWKYARTADSQ